MKKNILLLFYALMAIGMSLHALQRTAWAQEAEPSPELEFKETFDPEFQLDLEDEFDPDFVSEPRSRHAPEPGPNPEQQPARVRQPEQLIAQTIFDDKLLLEGYTEKYSQEPLEILLAMMKDDTLNPIKMAAAIRVFKNTYARETVSREKRLAEKILLRRLNRTDSKYLQIEIRHTLCLMNRYKYFKSMIPALILNLQHYNSTVNELAFESLIDIISEKNLRAREARIIFNTLRKMLFLSRKRLSQVNEPDEKLTRKLEILRYAIKVLGTQELRRLPKEVINLL